MARACGWSARRASSKSVLRVCRSEAKAAFGDNSLYLEKWLDENRHVEVQVIIDRYGHGVHLGERDCSVQRRHQKILEEAPSPALSEAARADLAERAIRASVAAGYENVGTLEFLVDRDGSFYFIEINCRIQVEHPLTEMLTGVDLLTTQIRIAAGEPLGFSQADVTFTGHALEFRINAEDPSEEFRPSAGLVGRYHAPGGPGVRMDSHLYTGYDVPPFYDSLLGKLIVWGPDRRDGHRPGARRARRTRRRGRGHERRDPPGAARERDLPRRPVHDESARPRRGCRDPGGRRPLVTGGDASADRARGRDADLHRPRRLPRPRTARLGGHMTRSCP